MNNDKRNYKKSFLQRMQLKATAVISGLADITTDAIPDKPRSVKHRSSTCESTNEQMNFDQTGNRQRTKATDFETDEDYEDQIDDKVADSKSKNKNSQGKKRDRKDCYKIPESNGGIQIINSVGVHIGSNNFYRPEIVLNSKKDSAKPENVKTHVDLSQDIIDLMASKEQVKSDHIIEVSQHVGHNWIELGKKLGCSQGQLQQFKTDYNPQSEVIYQMLLHWKHDKTDDATLGVLCQGLWSCDEKEAVEILARFVKDECSV